MKELDDKGQERDQSCMGSSGLDVEECPREQGGKAALRIQPNYTAHHLQNDTMETSYSKDCMHI